MSGGLFSPGTGSSGIANVNAIWQADANDQGVLFPRLTTTQRDALVLGVGDAGLWIYNTTTSAYNSWTGAAWVALGSGGGSAPADATYITQTANSGLSAEQALSTLSTGLMKVTTTTGVITSITDSAGLAGAISDETGTGALVFATSPALVTPAITGATTLTGAADTQQLVITGNATQTGDIVRVKDNAGNILSRYKFNGGFVNNVWDTTTNATSDSATLSHDLTSGSVAANFGPALLFAGQDSTTADVSMARIRVQWIDPTHASRTALARFRVIDSAAERTVLEMTANGSAPLIGFLGAAAVVKQASGADLTNNVTSGGTTDTIANYTDLSVYANDSAAIRNDIYQLARKLKMVNDALRLYGLLT